MSYKVNLQKEIRMYCLTLYNISEIQKGIQSLHGVVEYGQKYKDDEDYNLWANKHKTVILLNGGISTNPNTFDEFFDSSTIKGSMEKHELWLRENNIKYSVFNEPDLNYSTTSLCFLTDERIFNKQKYPLEFNYTFLLNNPNYIKDMDNDTFKFKVWVSKFKLA